MKAGSRSVEDVRAEPLLSQRRVEEQGMALVGGGGTEIMVASGRNAGGDGDGGDGGMLFLAQSVHSPAVASKR